MKRSNGVDRGGVAKQTIPIAIISLFLCTLAGCGKRLQRLESNQIVMEEKVDANAKRVEIMAYNMEKAQAQLKAAIEEVKQGNEITLAEAIATRYEQRKLREASDSNDDLIRAGVTRISEKQKVLGLSLGQVDSRTREIGADVVALASDQQRLRTRISGDHRHVVAEIGEVKENQVKTHGLSAQTLAQAESIGNGVAKIQRDQASLSRTVKGNDEKLKVQIAGVAAQQQGMHETLSDTHAVALIISNKVGQLQDKQTKLHALSQIHADQLNSGIAQVEVLQQQQKGLGEWVHAQADVIKNSITDVQRQQAELASGVQENQSIARTIVADVKKVKDQQELLRELIQGEADTLGAALTEIGDTQNRIAVDMDNSLEIASDIKGQVTQAQLKQVNSHVKAMAARIATLDGSVSRFESRLAVLSAALKGYHQERTKQDESLSEGLASLAQALEQIKVNQMLLSRRLNQTREDARIYNERFQGALDQLRKAGTKVKPEPKPRTLPPQDDESDK